MNKRILVLEDDADFLECVSIILETEGYTVIRFQEMSTPEEILAAEPDCILLDEIMPSISGHTICMILKRMLSKQRSLPIILMSGVEDLPQRAQLCEADAFVHKPFSSNDDFVRMIYELLYSNAA